MPARPSFDYAVIRVVPRVEREEFINAGVILFCAVKDFLGARVTVDEARLAALFPGVELEAVRSHLETIPRICAGGPSAGPIGRMAKKERWHWLVAPKSTILQCSPVHSGVCDDPERSLEKLFVKMVR